MTGLEHVNKSYQPYHTEIVEIKNSLLDKFHQQKHMKFKCCLMTLTVRLEDFEWASFGIFFSSFVTLHTTLLFLIW